MHAKWKQLLIGTAVTLGFAASANAATITYNNAEPTPKIELTVDDAASPGKFRFSLTTEIGTADYLGLGFNFAGAGISQSDISLVSALNKNGAQIFPALKLYGNNTESQTVCGDNPGDACNFQGGGSRSVFDYIIRIGEQGGGGQGGINYVASVVFDIAAVGSLDSLFTDFAVRAQSTTNEGGSIKTDLTPTPSPVPLPAGLPLLGSGLLAIGIMRRRRAAKASA